MFLPDGSRCQSVHRRAGHPGLGSAGMRPKCSAITSARIGRNWGSSQPAVAPLPAAWGGGGGGQAGGRHGRPGAEICGCFGVAGHPGPPAWGIGRISQSCVCATCPRSACSPRPCSAARRSAQLPAGAGSGGGCVDRHEAVTVYPSGRPRIGTWARSLSATDDLREIDAEAGL